MLACYGYICICTLVFNLSIQCRWSVIVIIPCVCVCVCVLPLDLRDYKILLSRRAEMGCERSEIEWFRYKMRCGSFDSLAVLQHLELLMNAKKLQKQTN